MKTVVVKRRQVEGTRPQQASEPILSLDLRPSLLSPIQQQLAQQMAQLIQRPRSPPNLTEGRDVEHLTGG
jgi:hypothetical protein